MKIPRHRSGVTCRSRRPESGVAATVIVLALLFLMMIFIVGNSRVLSHLKRELQRVEQRQAQRYAGAASTNPPPAKPGAATER